jgi:hypothetical protein
VWSPTAIARGDVSRPVRALLLFWSHHVSDARVGFDGVDGDSDETIAAAVEATHSAEKVVIGGDPLASVVVLFLTSTSAEASGLRGPAQR